jgi:ABC-type Fe3+-hydroxamate transport system substrate-binding protein
MIKPRRYLLFAWIAGVVACGGCGNAPTPAPTAKSPRIASLVPAATDLIVEMGAADHLVAVSNWDASRDPIKNLPHVGDYQTIDWEKLAAARPQIMIIFMSGERMPAGIQQHADQLNIRLVNVKTERIADIFSTIDALGAMLEEPQKASALKQSIQTKLDAVAARVKDQPKVRTMVARDEDGFALIAGDTFVNDLLEIAGGENVAGSFPVRYPNIDRERVLELSPAAVIQLMPDAPPQVVERARQLWRSTPQIPAVRDGRLYIYTDWYVLQPGSHIGELAEKLADSLHPR